VLVADSAPVLGIVPDATSEDGIPEPGRQSGCGRAPGEGVPVNALVQAISEVEE